MPPAKPPLALERPYLKDRSRRVAQHRSGAARRARAVVHGMAMSTQLTDAQIADLTAFLETL